jgi:hypothetical protein
MFMAIPSYSNLKLKIPGPAGIITVETKAQQALDGEQDSIELVAVAATELKECASMRNPLQPAMPSMMRT